MKAIRVTNLSYRYARHRSPVLSDITFKITAGETLGITGRNGCGKSTLCRCLCGIIPHYLGGEMTGEVTVFGQDTRKTPLRKLSQMVGMVLQNPDTQLFSPTVEDELAFAPENFCLPPDQIKERVVSVLEWLDLFDLRLEHPHHLSGGQKQLVALGAILTLDPQVIILDEVLAHLDGEGVQRILEVLAKLRRQGKTLLVVDHTGQALKKADKIFVMEDGRIIHRGPGDKLLSDYSFLSEHKLN